MGQPLEPYQMILVESYEPIQTSGLHGAIHIRPVPGQGIDPSLHVRCSKKLSENYPPGTRFIIKGKITDRDGGRPFIHSDHRWDYEVVSKP